MLLYDSHVIPKWFLGKTIFLLTLGFVSPQSAFPGDSFYDLSLEELADQPIVESSKTDFQLFEAPNGAFVFDEDAIQNLPVDSIPELLRYAPGTHIMRSSNGAWGMGIRGMNSRFLSRSLFTVDEQSQYGTIFNGLFGSDHDLLLDDVAAVEVVYGPGGTLWGTNAANGRVNVILKSVFETEGTQLKSRVGTNNRSIDARHGWLIGEDSGMRVWAKKSDRQSPTASHDDTWKTERAGIRYEKRPSSQDLLSVSIESSQSDLGFSRDVLDPLTGYAVHLIGPETQENINAQVKWTHQKDSDNGYSIRAWAGNTELRSPYVNYDFELAGTEFRALFSPSPKHKFVLAAGITSDNDTLIDSPETSFISNYEPRNTSAHLGGEYTISLEPKNLQLSFGLSGSYNSNSDSVEALPSVRLMFSPGENSRAWLAYSSSSRAIPSGIKAVQSMTNGYLPFGPLSIPTPYGTFEIDTQMLNLVWADIPVERERLDAIELGYRINQPGGGSLMLTAYANKYQNIIGARDYAYQPVLTVADPYLLNQILFDNVADGDSFGLDASKEWILPNQQSVTLNYSYITDSFEVQSRFLPVLDDMPLLQGEVDSIANNVPTHQASLWYVKSIANWRFDLGLRYNSGFEGLRSQQASSFQSDLRITWAASDQLRLSLVGRNLSSPDTDEAYLRDYIGRGSEIPREAYLEANLKF